MPKRCRTLGPAAGVTSLLGLGPSRGRCVSACGTQPLSRDGDRERPARRPGSPETTPRPGTPRSTWPSEGAWPLVSTRGRSRTRLSSRPGRCEPRSPGVDLRRRSPRPGDRHPPPDRDLQHHRRDRSRRDVSRSRGHRQGRVPGRRGPHTQRPVHMDASPARHVQGPRRRARDSRRDDRRSARRGPRRALRSGLGGSALASPSRRGHYPGQSRRHPHVPLGRAGRPARCRLRHRLHEGHARTGRTARGHRTRAQHRRPRARHERDPAAPRRPRRAQRRTFAATLGTTLAIGATERVTILLDKRLPAGSWKARVDLHSGLVERHTQATITFPAARQAATWPYFVVITGLALLLLGITALLVASRRRSLARLSPLA